MSSNFLFFVWVSKSNCWMTTIFLELISRNYFLVFDSLLDASSGATRLFFGEAIATIVERCWDRLGWEGGSRWELVWVGVDDPEDMGSPPAESHHVEHVHIFKELHDPAA